MKTKIAIIGAGLAGVTAAIRLKELGHTPVLIDSSLPDANGDIGGFAKFSGAKFSLPPAGMGLVEITKTETALWNAVNQVTNLFGLELGKVKESIDKSESSQYLRRYQSLVLTPNEIDDLIYKTKEKIAKLGIKLIQGACTNIFEKGSGMSLNIQSNGAHLNITCDVVFYAGGRLGTDMLIKAGVQATDTKGIDVGVRIEFLQCEGLSQLRKLGPDAKLIKGACRTFCLNLPGEIYRYPFGEISIPGGVVAPKETKKSNVGILFRSPDKKALLEQIIAVAQSVGKNAIEKEYDAQGTAFGTATALIKDLYGEEIAGKLQDFCDFLEEQSLISWAAPHIVHAPLIDWHWNTFSKPRTFKTSNCKIFCLGDSSGHARGLLQAAVSGWLAAEEYANEN